MSFQDSRSSFSVYIFTASIDRSSEVKSRLAMIGYDAYVLTDQEDLVMRIQENPPHVIVFDTTGLLTTLEEFVALVLQANAEVQFVAIGPSESTKTIETYRPYNIQQLITLDQHLGVRVGWAVDAICEKLYLTYQNEQLFEQLQDQKKQAALPNKNQDSPSLIGVSSESIGARVDYFSINPGKDEMLKAFMSYHGGHHPKLKALYLRFVPTVQAMIPLHGWQVDVEPLKGLMLTLSPLEQKDLFFELKKNNLPSKVLDFLKNQMHLSSWKVFPLVLQNQLEGVFVFWGHQPEDHWFQFSNDFVLFQLVFAQNILARRLEILDIFDPVTDLSLKSHFMKTLNEEIVRARRLQKPLSLVRFSVDRYDQILRDVGQGNMDVIFKSLAALLRKTSRPYDMLGRTGENEISILLPHSPRKGAALRAERLRRTVESNAMSVNGVKVTLSFGVSEYPSLSGTAEELSLSASTALDHIRERGGNKVCLFKAADGFKPDFDVPPL